MLVDIVPKYDTLEKISKLDPATQKLWESFSTNDRLALIPFRLAQGLWGSASLNAEWLAEEEENLHPFHNGNLHELPKDSRKTWEILEQSGLLSPHGVCDSPEQLLAHPEYSKMFAHEHRKFTIFVTLVRKKDQPLKDGWRWHKWGEYIGTKEPQREYLYDEPNIDEVCLFSIVEHIPGVSHE